MTNKVNNATVVDLGFVRNKKKIEEDLQEKRITPAIRNFFTCVRDFIIDNFNCHAKDHCINNFSMEMVEFIKDSGFFEYLDVSTEGYIHEEIDYTDNLTSPQLLSVNRAVYREDFLDVNGKSIFDNLNLYLIFTNYEITGVIAVHKEIKIKAMEYIGHASIKVSYEVSTSSSETVRRSTHFSLRLGSQYLPVNALFFSRIIPSKDQSGFDGHFKFKTTIDYQNDYCGKYSYGQFRQLKHFNLVADQECETGAVILKNVIDEDNKDHVFSFTLDRPMRLIKTILVSVPGKPDNVMPVGDVKDIASLQPYRDNYIVEFTMESRECGSIRRTYNLRIDNNGMQIFETEIIQMSGLVNPSSVKEIPSFSEFNDVETFTPYVLDINTIHEISALSTVPLILNENTPDEYKSQFYGTSGINSYGYLVIHEAEKPISYVAIYTRSKAGYRLAEVYCFEGIEEIQVSPGIVNYQLNYMVRYISNNLVTCSVGSFMIHQSDVYSIC